MEENKEQKVESAEEKITKSEDSKNAELISEKGSEPSGEAIKKSDETEEDEYAENPEEVLSEEDLKELKKMEGKEEPEGIAAWIPRTKLGKEVKEGKIKNIDEILKSKRKILESEIVDSLIDVKSDLIAIGQSKGKFGGGKRRAWRQTQRKTKEGNIPSFSTMAVVGDEDGHVGIGSGKAKETLPARDKAIRKAKLNIMKVERTCSAFDCACGEKHTVLFKTTGKSGSVKVTLIPAPQGTGLVAGDELKKILRLAGIKDAYTKTSGKRRTTFNLVKACIDALKKTNKK